MLQSFIHSYEVPNLYDFLSLVKHKKRILKSRSSHSLLVVHAVIMNVG